MIKVISLFLSLFILVSESVIAAEVTPIAFHKKMEIDVFKCLRTLKDNSKKVRVPLFDKTIHMSKKFVCSIDVLSDVKYIDLKSLTGEGVVIRAQGPSDILVNSDMIIKVSYDSENDRAHIDLVIQGDERPMVALKVRRFLEEVSVLEFEYRMN